MTTDSLIEVEVAYATPEKQHIERIKVSPSTTAYAAAEQAQMERFFPEIDVQSASMGIFGKRIKDPKVEVLRAGDRVEIYRPLLIDPKQARLNRAAKKTP